MRHPTRVVLLVFLVLSTVDARLKENRYDIAQVGCFHGNEVTARGGEKWSALFRNGDLYQLADVTISVDSCRDQISDEPGQTTGRSIRIPGDRTPLVLVRGLRAFGPRPLKIETAARMGMPAGGRGQAPWKLPPGERFRLKLRRSQYDIAATGDYDPSRPEGDRLVIGYHLRITNPVGRVQDLAVPRRFGEDGVPSILWAGDLDRDGKLDLLIDLSRENVASRALFLSSQASGKRLMRLVASREYVGC